MTLDREILAKAKAAREAVLELERQQEHATVELHHLIRRLHAAGGSLREIADVLGLSHQRVHQIVGKDPLIETRFPVEQRVIRDIRHRRGRKRQHGFFTRFSEQGRDVVIRAQEEVRALKHGHVGTEHILLGLLREDGSIAQRALAALGIGYDAARAAIVREIGEGTEAATGQIPFTRAAKRSLELALREAMRLGHDYIGAEHVLLGLVRTKNAGAADVLASLGGDPDSVTAAVESLLVE